MNTELLVKVQFDSKNKLMKKQFTTLADLKSAVVSCYPKRLGHKEIELKYEDSDGDKFEIAEDSDVQAFKEYATSLGSKKATVIVEATGDKDEESKEEIVNSETEKLVEGVKQALMEIRLDDAKDQKEELKDFRFADALGEVESLLNSEEKVRPGQIFKALMTAARGTKAEIHFKRMMRRIRGGKRSPSHGKMRGGKCCGKKDKSQRKAEKEKNRSSSESPECGFDGFQPVHPHDMMGYENCGPMGYPFPHMMPPHCFPGFGEFGSRRHRFGKGKVMKFFKKFMDAFKESSSSSSESSSAERKEQKKEKQKQNQIKRQEYKTKRPQILEKPSEIKGSISTSMAIKIQNTSPWPFMLTAIKKISGDEAIKFEDFKHNERLFKEKIVNLSIPVALPSKVGEYSATFGFLNKNSKLSGEEFTVKFVVTE